MPSRVGQGEQVCSKNSLVLSAGSAYGDGALPRQVRFAVYRNMVQCDAAPSEKLVLKVAETKEELEACFQLLHDAYVKVGFMKPDPSGLRVTIYHALPTTTTLLAKYDGRVVGTLSLIRDSALGFSMQKIFNIKDSAGGAISQKFPHWQSMHVSKRGSYFISPHQNDV